MSFDPADEWLRADAEARGQSLSDYEREFGIELAGGPAENRARYNETPAGLMTQDDFAGAIARERTYTPERNRKRRRARSQRRSCVSSDRAA